MTNYVCTDLAQPIDGAIHCKTWKEVPDSLIPELTINQANELAIAFVTVLAIAWCFKTLGQFIKGF